MAIEDDDLTFTLGAAISMPESDAEAFIRVQEAMKSMVSDAEHMARYNMDTLSAMKEMVEIQRQIRTEAPPTGTVNAPPPPRSEVQSEDTQPTERISEPSPRGQSRRKNVHRTPVDQPGDVETPTERLAASGREVDVAQPQPIDPTLQVPGRDPSLNLSPDLRKASYNQQRGRPEEAEVSEARQEVDEELENGSMLEQMKALSLAVQSTPNLGRGGLQGALEQAPGFLSKMGGVGGSLGTALSVGTKAIPVIGTASAVLGATQVVGQQYQDLKNQGLTRGGGVREGLEFQSQVSAMALNPFITNDQARQIMQTALNEGYTGKEFETLTEFMSENMKEFNLSVADSMKLVENNVELGKQSIESLGTQLGTLKELAPDSNTSLKTLQEQYTQVTTQMVGAGAGGAAAGQVGVAAGQLFQNEIEGQKNPLSGEGANIVGLLNNPLIQGQIAQQRGQNEVPNTIPDVLSAEGPEATLEAVQGALRPMAERTALMDQQREGMGMAAWQGYLQSLGLNYNTPQAKSLRDQILGGDWGQQAGRAVEKAAGNKERKLTGDERVGALAEGTKEGFKNLGGVVKDFGQFLVGKPEDWEDVKDSWNKFQRGTDASDIEVMSGQENKAIENLVQNYNAEDIRLKGGAASKYLNKDGTLKKGVDLVDVLTDQGVRNDLESGKTQVSVTDQSGRSTEYQTLTDLAGSGYASGDSGTYTSESGGSWTLDLSPEAKRFFNVVGGPNVSEHESEANQGKGTTNSKTRRR